MYSSHFIDDFAQTKMVSYLISRNYNSTSIPPLLRYLAPQGLKFIHSGNDQRWMLGPLLERFMASKRKTTLPILEPTDQARYQENIMYLLCDM